MLGEERDGFPIRRPEGKLPALGAGQGFGGRSVKGTDKKHLAAILQTSENDTASVVRDGRRSRLISKRENRNSSWRRKSGADDRTRKLPAGPAIVSGNHRGQEQGYGQHNVENNESSARSPSGFGDNCCGTGGRGLRDPVKFVLDVSGALPTIIGIFDQAAPNGVLKRRRSKWFKTRDGLRLFFQNRRGNAELAFAGEGALAGQHLVEHSTEREDVAAAIDFFAFDLFGRHVLEGANNGAFLCDRRMLRRSNGGQCGQARGRRCSASKAKVQELGSRFGEHDIAGLEVAVNDSVTVSFVESVGDFAPDLQDLIGWKRALLQTLGERLAFDELHDEIAGAVL